ncbi:MAG: DNA ligase [Alphaproteobacteria bacterium]|nr:DNA ligase [Alphaproteobacteria bacterium]
MADLEDGDSVEVQGSAATPYVLKNTGGVYSCTCPAWRNQGAAIDKRTCKHLRKLRGDAAEAERIGGESELPAKSGDGTAPALLLAHKWETDHDPRGWWMSEKLDGVRALWDGERFVSRLGNAFAAPDWFVASLPRTPLDGELFGGRKLFQKTVSIVRRADAGQGWRDLKYVVFDAPEHGGTFEDRLGWIADQVGGMDPAFVAAHPHEVCEGLDHLRAELARVEALGGEGLMLRKPRSKYEKGRSTTLLKVKSFFDADGVVVDHQAGTGKHKGRVGSLLVETPDGTRFSVGTGLSDREREEPPPVGTVIVYRYQELTDAGVPRFPSYVGIRAEQPAPPPPADPGEAFLAVMRDVRPHLDAVVRRLQRAWPQGRPVFTELPEEVLDRLGLNDAGLIELQRALEAAEAAAGVVGDIVDAD